MGIENINENTEIIRDSIMPAPDDSLFQFSHFYLVLLNFETISPTKTNFVFIGSVSVHY